MSDDSEAVDTSGENMPAEDPSETGGHYVDTGDGDATFQDSSETQVNPDTND